MKIAVLSLVFDNYGTRLQSYALCKVLGQIVGDRASVEVVNMDTPWTGTKNLSKKKLIISSLKEYGLLLGIRHIYEMFKWRRERRIAEKRGSSIMVERRSSLFNLVNSLIPYTTKKYTAEDIRAGAIDFYDAFLVGSDQVWNGIKVPNQDIFLLNFAKNKPKLSYAASFGMTTIPEKMKSIYSEGIKHFDSLLLREDEGVTLCKDLGRKDAHKVLDPTLLLDIDEYEGVMSSEIPEIQGKYVLVYSLNQSYKIYSETCKMCKKYGYKMVVLKRSFVPPFIDNIENSIELFAVSPGGFLSLIKKAECVVTNSYHALLFSINAKTPFYLYLNNIDEENSRLLTVCKMCSLDKRVFYETQKLPIEIGMIDYASVHDILLEERKKSMQLLEKSICKYILR